LPAFINVTLAKMDHLVKLVEEIADKMWQIIAIVWRVFMIQETKCIVFLVFINVKHAKWVLHAFLVKVILDKMFLIIATV
jgi:hypothetical protein